MKDIIVTNKCCFGFGFSSTINITKDMDENHHEMIVLLDDEQISSIMKPVDFCSLLYSYGINGFHLNKFTSDGSCNMGLVFCDIPNGRILLSGHCMINGKGYNVEDFSIHKDLYIGGKVYDYMAVCKIKTLRRVVDVV
jgi:hypothetical protein